MVSNKAILILSLALRIVVRHDMNEQIETVLTEFWSWNAKHHIIFFSSTETIKKIRGIHRRYFDQIFFAMNVLEGKKT